MAGVVYIIDGSRVTSQQSFYDLVGEAVDGPGTYFGKNLDSFHDCLYGGYGTPDDKPYSFVLKHSHLARAALGYEETVRWREVQLPHVHPTNTETWQLELDAARDGLGETLFAIILDIFMTAQIPITLE